MAKTEIFTNRLLLRRWRESDVLPFAQICADVEVMRHIGSGNPMTLTQVHADIATYEACWHHHGFGQFAVELKASKRFIGFAGLGNHTLLPQFQFFTEIGWRFARNVWGQGYATEAAKAVLEYANIGHGITDIISICQVDNLASERVMQKIGLVSAGENVAPNSGRKIKIYQFPKG